MKTEMSVMQAITMYNTIEALANQFDNDNMKTIKTNTQLEAIRKILNSNKHRSEYHLDRIMRECRRGQPLIVCLCGSTRFIETFAIQQWELERAGNIVLGCTLLPRSYCPVDDHFAEHTGCKDQCDELHLRKIDLADSVLVINVGGYIGESTLSEIAYARKTGKPVSYLEPCKSEPTT